MPKARINEQDLFYAATKLDRRPVLMLIHGAGGSHLDWPPELRRYEPYGSCAIDLPGHGRSARPGRSAVSAYADVVLELVTELELSEVILVGHSMGGAIAMDLALRRCEEVVALVLVASGARLRVKKDLLDLVDSNFVSAVKHVTATAWGPNAEPDSVRRGSQLMLTGDSKAMRMDFAACNDFDIMTQLGDIAVPTLVLVGTEDRMTPPKFAHYLADHIPGAELISVADAGHMLAMEQPQLVSDAIRDFIQRRLR